MRNRKIIISCIQFSPGLYTVSEARPADVEQARRAASAWMASSPRHRADVLRRCAQLVAEHGPSLAALDAAATGRRVLTEIEFFVPRCADAFATAAERARAPVCVHHELGGGVIGTEIGADLVRATAHSSAPLLDLCRASANAMSAGSALVIDMPLASRAVAHELERLLVKAGVPRGLVGLRFADEGGVAPRPSAAVIMKGADVPRAIEAVLAARDPRRRTPDLSEMVLFVDKAALRAAETAATAWCKRAALAMDPTCGSPVEAAALPSVTAGATVVHAGQPGEATILRVHNAQAPLPTGLFAPVLRIVPFDSDRTLLAMLDRTGFDSVAIFAGDDRRRADEIARAAPAPSCTIDAYNLTRESARELPPEWTVAVARDAATKRVLAFPSAPA
ncbi:MAG: aldehyde dehydrogenase family protein [Beijerinckiaceae bacterium]|nr:aldehyde dehydrogenase family protein [Beijerinckiaceae bacterium]